jgi:hypothetical protein
VRRLLWIVGLIAVVLVLLVAGTVLVLRARDSTTTVTVDEALGAFRGDEADDGSTPRRPEPGVYLYETVGGEHIDALGGADHTYPSQTTMSVKSTDCGYQVRWDVFRERFDELDMCVVDGGETIATTRQYREFFGIGNDRTYSCDASAIVRADPAVIGETRSTPCTAPSSDGDISITVIGFETIEVGGQQAEAAHLLLETTLSGDVRGGSTLHYWADPETGLIFRRESSVSTDADSPLGVTRYEENYTVQLVSLTPNR